VSRACLLLVSLLCACSESPSRTDARLDARQDRRNIVLTDRGGDQLHDLVAQGSDRCLGAAPIAVGIGMGKQELQGTTAGALNEYGTGVRCGGTDPLIGPQRYYAVDLQQGTTYRFELRPSFDAVLLLTSSCGANAMNTDCGSQGETGAFSGKIAAGGSGSLFFSPTVSGTYRLGVDSASASAQGAYTLVVEGFGTPANGRCVQAQQVTLGSGKLSLDGSTLGAADEFPGQLHCGLGRTLAGPQVYYSLPLTAGSWYRLGLSPQFPATLFVASAAASCVAPNLELDCGGMTGTVLPLLAAGGSAATAFAPATTGNYVLAVKGPDATAAGSFNLTVESFSPPGNMICSAATPLTLGAGAAATGSTQGYLNDLGALVRCGPSAPALLGPQAYYKVDLQAKTYQVLLKPSFAAVLAIGQSCQNLPADCGSGGLSGATLSVPAGKTGSLLFKAAAQSFIIAVDSLGPAASGAFDLQIKEHVPPQNGSCAQPKLLSLQSGTVLEAGDTSPLANDLAGISCGLTGVGPWSGPQAYFQLALTGGKSYQIDLQPEAGFDPALYAFPASTACTADAVNAACAGSASDQLGPGVAESLLLKPAADTTMMLVVDSWSTSEVGSFTLSVVEK
jgi:hypothetical protein